MGDAQFSVSIDGGPSALGGTVTALNAQGQSQLLHLASTLSAGTHDVGVSFLNDAYGGTAATDRNLYVKSIAVNGDPVSGSSATLLSAGTAHFQISIPPF